MILKQGLMAAVYQQLPDFEHGFNLPEHSSGVWEQQFPAGRDYTAHSAVLENTNSEQEKVQLSDPLCILSHELPLDQGDQKFFIYFVFM